MNQSDTDYITLKVFWLFVANENGVEGTDADAAVNSRTRRRRRRDSSQYFIIFGVLVPLKMVNTLCSANIEKFEF